MNLGENTSLFRESFKGFNKDDVAAFIQKLSKDYADNEEKYKERIFKLTEENNAKTQEIKNLSAGSAATSETETKLKEESAQLSEQLNEKNAEIEILNNLLRTSTADADKYKDDANKLLSEVRSKDAEIIELKKSASVSENSGEATEKIIQELNSANSETINELSTQVAELSAKVEELNSEKELKEISIMDLKNQLEQNKTQVEDEQKIYENITADLGSIIYSAKKSAEDILAKAKSDADNIITLANIKKHSILEENEQHMAQFREKYRFIKTEHEKLIENFNAVSEIYSESLLEIKDAIENINTII